MGEGITWANPGSDLLSSVLRANGDTLEEIHIRGVNAKKSASSAIEASKLAGAVKGLDKLKEFELSVRGGLCQSGAWAIEAGLPSGEGVRWQRRAMGQGFVWTRESDGASTSTA